MFIKGRVDVNFEGFNGYFKNVDDDLESSI